MPFIYNIDGANPWQANALSPFVFAPDFIKIKYVQRGDEMFVDFRIAFCGFQLRVKKVQVAETFFFEIHTSSLGTNRRRKSVGKLSLRKLGFQQSK
jgi:hypothetical protein